MVIFFLGVVNEEGKRSTIKTKVLLLLQQKGS